MLTSKLVSVAPRSRKEKTNKEAIRRAILGELNRVFYDRYGPEFPDDDAGKDDLEILLRLHALHPTHGRERMKNVIETRAPWMAREAAEILIHDLATMDARRFWGPWWRDELKLAMNLTTLDRERLKAWHIPPIDKTAEELAQYRKDKRSADRRAKRRAAGAKPRSIYLLRSKSTKKPWDLEGKSRATWYRDQKKNRESQCGPSARIPSETRVSLSLVDSKQSRSKPQSHLRETSTVTAKKALQVTHLSHSSRESQMKGKCHG